MENNPNRSKENNVSDSINDGELNNMPNFEEHMVEVKKQEWKASIKQEALKYEVNERDYLLLSEIDKIDNEHDKELALIGFGLPVCGQKNPDRENSSLNGIEKLAIEYANRSNKDIGVTEYFREKYGDDLYNFADDDKVSRTRGIMELEEADRYLSGSQEEREKGSFFYTESLEFSKQVLAKNKNEQNNKI